MERFVRFQQRRLAVPLYLATLSLSLALAACGGGGDGALANAPQPAPSAPPSFRDFQPAVGLLGQSGFTHDQADAGQSNVGPATLEFAAGVAVSDSGRLFVADTGNDRVLVFGATESPGSSAEFALGRADMFSDGPTTAAKSFQDPRAVTAGAGMVAVVDRLKHRVVVYTTEPASGMDEPLVVVGQQAFESSTPGCDRRTLRFPSAAHITAGGMLIVADAGNSRVLIWDTVPDGNGRDATFVLGQPDFVSCGENQENAVPVRGSMNSPRAVWGDGNRLAVADTSNNRVLLWTSPITRDGQLPDHVLGQADFDSAQARSSAANTLHGPRGLSSDGTRLAVADSGNHRVLIWNEWPSRNEQEANVVLGQPNFLENLADNGDTSRTTAQSMDAPEGLAFGRGGLWVADQGNNRILFFKPQ